MRHNLPRRTPVHLDRVLDGRPTTPDPLSELVAELRAPGTAREGAGSAAASAAFAAAAEPAQPVRSSRRPATLKGLAGKVLVAKLMAVTASTLAIGGVAFAATTGHLPEPLPHAGHDAPLPATASPVTVHRSTASSRPGMTARSESRPRPAPTTSHGATGNPTTGHPAINHAATKAPTHRAASPSPSLTGLCHAWLARPADSGAADRTPAAAALIAAAGGKHSVIHYCYELLGPLKPSEHLIGRPREVPVHPAHPAAAPNDHQPYPTHRAPWPGNHPMHGMHPGGPGDIPTHLGGH